MLDDGSSVEGASRRPGDQADGLIRRGEVFDDDAMSWSNMTSLFSVRRSWESDAALVA